MNAASRYSPDVAAELDDWLDGDTSALDRNDHLTASASRARAAHRATRIQTTPAISHPGRTTHHREDTQNMALQRATKTSGGFLDLKELAADGPILCVFRVVEFQEPEKATGFDGINLPVIADVLVCSGSRTGEVHLGERFIGAITSTLRGVRNPKSNKGEQPQPPTTHVGAEIVARVKVLNPGKANAGAVGDEPSDTEFGAVEQVYQGGAAWNSASADTAQQPVGAGAGGGSKRPW